MESVLGTLLLTAQLLHSHKISWASNYGLQQLVGPGTPLLANLAGEFNLQALAGVHAVIWRGASACWATPPDQAIAGLDLMNFGKILSPLCFIWTLPAWVLVAARDRVLVVVSALTLVHTHAEFPKLYWVFFDWTTAPLLVMIVRNVMLAAFFAIAVWRLWTLPISGST